MKFPMPAADELAPDRDQQADNGPDLSALDDDLNDLIEGDGQPINGKADKPDKPEAASSPTPTPENASQNDGPDMSELDETDDESDAAETPEAAADSEQDAIEPSDVGEGEQDAVETDEQPGEEPENPIPTSEPAADEQTADSDAEDFVARIWNAEQDIRKAEAIVEARKEDLKEARAIYEGKVIRLREIASEGIAGENDARRPLFSQQQPAGADKPSETADSPTPTPDDERQEPSDTDDEPQAEIVQRPLTIRLIVPQEVLDVSGDTFQLTSGKEYSVHDIDEGGDVIILDDKGQETTLAADEFDVVEWSGAPGESGMNRKDWPKGKIPAKVVLLPAGMQVNSDLTAGKVYEVHDYDEVLEDEFAIIDDADETFLIGDGQYQVVEWGDAAATTPDGDDWKEVEITELDLPDGIVNTLLGDKNKIETIGQLCAVKDDGADFTACVNIGESKAKKIEDAIEKFFAARKAEERPE